MKKAILCLALQTATLAFADPALPVPEGTTVRMFPEESTVRGEYEYKKRFNSEAEKNAALQQQIDAAREKLATEIKSGAFASSTAVQKPRGSSSARSSVVLRSPSNVDASHFVQTFAVEESERSNTILPLGSFVRAKVLSGVEANTQEPYPMLLQTEYAFTGPNHTKIDLSNCFLIAKAKANLSTERVLGEASEISCVRTNGEAVKRTVRGYIAGEDSTFGMTGQLISKQGQVLLAAVLANLAKGAGEAVGAAQTTSQAVAGLAGSANATNVTGSQTAFIAGKAAADAASIISTWYLDYAKQVIPSIAVGSGRDVWVVMLDSVDVPRLDNSSNSEDLQ